MHGNDILHNLILIRMFILPSAAVVSPRLAYLCLFGWPTVPSRRPVDLGPPGLVCVGSHGTGRGHHGDGSTTLSLHPLGCSTSHATGQPQFRQGCCQRVRGAHNWLSVCLELIPWPGFHLSTPVR